MPIDTPLVHDAVAAACADGRAAAAETIASTAAKAATATHPTLLTINFPPLGLRPLRRADVRTVCRNALRGPPTVAAFTRFSHVR